MRQGFDTVEGLVGCLLPPDVEADRLAEVGKPMSHIASDTPETDDPEPAAAHLASLSKARLWPATLAHEAIAFGESAKQCDGTSPRFAKVDFVEADSVDRDDLELRVPLADLWREPDMAPRDHPAYG